VNKPTEGQRKIFGVDGEAVCVAAALGWGTLGASSLLIGAIAAIAFDIRVRLIGLIMGFGAGVLISAVAFDLVEEAVNTESGHFAVVTGIFAGCGVFFLGDTLIDRFGGAERKNATGAQETGSPLAIVLGTVLDGIPESMVIGLTIFQGGAVGAAYLAAVFISNLPEANGGPEGQPLADTTDPLAVERHRLAVGTRVTCGLRALPERLAECRRLCSDVLGRRDPDDARRHDDAGGLRKRRQARRRRHDSGVRRRLHDPHARLKQAVALLLPALVGDLLMPLECGPQSISSKSASC
jgi:hypothetical protein